MSELSRRWTLWRSPDGLWRTWPHPGSLGPACVRVMPVAEHEEAMEALRAELKAERDAFVQLLNQDGESSIDIDAIMAKRPIENPCGLCGWSLDGHQHVYIDPRDWNGLCLHLACYKVVRVGSLEIELAAAREVTDEKVERRARAISELGWKWGWSGIQAQRRVLARAVLEAALVRVKK